MNLELTLPYRLYLLAYDTERERVTAGSYLPTVVRAGALAQLYLDGLLVDEEGRAKATTGRHSDPVLESVRREIADAQKPHKWLFWVSRNRPATLRAVRGRLDEALLIRVEPYRRLGLIPALRVTLRDPLVVPREQAAVARALESRNPVSGVDRADALAAAFAAVGCLRTAISRADARAARDRLKELGAIAAPLTKALQKAIQQIQSAT